MPFSVVDFQGTSSSSSSTTITANQRTNRPRKRSVINIDAGNKSDEHYKSKFSPFRYRFRSILLPLIRAETPILFKIQSLLRCKVFDLYFSWTANLAAHTFYVLILPIPIWFGSAELTRDLVWVLGFGVFFTGCLKDYFCLPRPRSPPVHRITMSGYTAKEYGLPSSHSANATGAALIFLVYLYEKIQNNKIDNNNSINNDSFILEYFSIFLIFVYYFSLLFGRIYCGMHGFLDLLFGSLIGIFCVIFRLLIKEHWDNFVFNFDLKLGLVSILIPVSIISITGILIHFHAEPVDDCPCFDDSVAFIGVVSGLEITHWLYSKSKYVLPIEYQDSKISTYYSYDQLGLVGSILRVVLGAILVLIWKTFSKKIIYLILPRIYKKINIYVPRRFFRPVSRISSEKEYETIYENLLSKDNISKSDLTFGKLDDKQGPASMSDYYEVLSTSKNARELEHDLDLKNRTYPACVALRPRYDVEVVGRLIVYAGIPFMAVFGFAVATRLVGLECAAR
ncbi:phosphatase PAP2 family protein [Ascoidea rubescens DSM 1968]|uniref:PAP2-domain-containing protein n=1 Tax=Ascoidea rubescens DSM 1968 TaxID=1344418 RepID=A0A1D2VQ58_9ASCO|nr:PAP2-domain-containing protein [Ascoidea rubescens DSM 1968]ODV63729.1 PAP2-domain-containing protein [Ascoidea rubescens DSM 1968]